MIIKININLRKQILELRQTFALFDVNKDGTICKEELKNVIEKVDIHLTEDQFNLLVDKLDRNNDDKIEFDGCMIISIL